MQIEQYSLLFKLALNDGSFIDQYAGSFNSIPHYRLDDIRYCKVFSNSQIVWEINKDSFVNPQNLNYKIRQGWLLAYYIKRVYPNIFR